MFAEFRESQRRVLRTKAVLTLPTAAQVSAKTFDIGANGIGLGIEEPMQVGLQCKIEVMLFLAGKNERLLLPVKVIYCILRGDGYRVGVQFLSVDSNSRKLVDGLLK